MIEYDKMRAVIGKGLKEYLNCPVIRSNQNEMPPSYPYLSYTITTLMSANTGTYGAYEDGTKRKPVTQTWSISVLSDDSAESVTLAVKAREWLDEFGTTYLNDNNVIVQSVGGVTNRDNFLTAEYEYRNGFDCVFWLFDTIAPNEGEGVIETVDLNGINVATPKTTEELNERLEKRLDGDL